MGSDPVAATDGDRGQRLRYVQRDIVRTARRCFVDAIASSAAVPTPTSSATVAATKHAAGSGALQCACAGCPGHTGHASPAARSHTVTTKSMTEAPEAANSSPHAQHPERALTGIAVPTGL